MSADYEATDPRYDGRITAPVLWDTATGQIVSNESADIIRMFNSAESLGALSTSEPDLYPSALADRVDAINQRVYDTVNNGVYATGFARSQEAYEAAFTALFDEVYHPQPPPDRRVPQPVGLHA